MTFDSSIAEQSQVTQCPNCKTAFHISDEQLLVANGQVRCGSCLTIFQADKYWLSEPDASAAEASLGESPLESEPDKHSLEPNCSPDADSVGATSSTDFAPPQEGRDFELSDSFLGLEGSGAEKSSFSAYETDDPETEDTPEQWAQALLEEEEPEERQAPRNEILSAILENQEGPQEANDPTTPNAMGLIDDEQADLAPDQLNGAEKWMQQVLGQEAPANQVTDPIAPPPPAEPIHVKPAQQEEPAEEYVPEVFRKSTQVNPQQRSGIGSSISRLAKTRTRLRALHALLIRGVSRALWSLAFVTALAVLALQITWHQAQRQSESEEPHPLIARICALAACAFPQAQNEAVMKQRQTAVFRSAEQPGTVTLTLELHNPSDKSGQFPALLTSFVDQQGHKVASSTLKPSQYLPAAKLQSTDPSTPVNTASILPGQTVQILLRFSDPGTAATDYQVSTISY